MSKQVFYDPESKRWRRLCLITDPLGVVVTILIIFFVVTLSRSPKMADFSLPSARRPLKTLKERPNRRRGYIAAATAAAHRRRHSNQRASEVPLNNGEGIRAAYYVPWDEGSFPSLTEHYSQIDLLFPDWLHVISTDGRIQAQAPENQLFDVVQGSVVHAPDAEHPVMQFLKQQRAQTEVFPLVNNYDPIANQWLTSIGDLLNDPDARALLRQNLMTFLASDNYHGLSIDFEEIPVKAQKGFQQFLAELSGDLHARGMKLYVNLPPDDNDYNYAKIAGETDGVILMNYDQHVPETTAGPVAGGWPILSPTTELYRGCPTLILPLLEDRVGASPTGGWNEKTKAHFRSAHWVWEAA